MRSTAYWSSNCDRQEHTSSSLPSDLGPQSNFIRNSEIAKSHWQNTHTHADVCTNGIACELSSPYVEQRGHLTNHNRCHVIMRQVFTRANHLTWIHAAVYCSVGPQDSSHVTVDCPSTIGPCSTTFFQSPLTNCRFIGTRTAKGVNFWFTKATSFALGAHWKPTTVAEVGKQRCCSSKISTHYTHGHKSLWSVASLNFSVPRLTPEWSPINISIVSISIVSRDEDVTRLGALNYKTSQWSNASEFDQHFWLVKTNARYTVTLQSFTQITGSR